MFTLQGTGQPGVWMVLACSLEREHEGEASSEGSEEAQGLRVCWLFGNQAIRSAEGSLQLPGPRT
eukprot:5828248-Heterocapsa_arctica.AAC.1